MNVRVAYQQAHDLFGPPLDTVNKKRLEVVIEHKFLCSAPGRNFKEEFHGWAFANKTPTQSPLLSVSTHRSRRPNPSTPKNNTPVRIQWASFCNIAASLLQCMWMRKLQFETVDACEIFGLALFEYQDRFKEIKCYRSTFCNLISCSMNL